MFQVPKSLIIVIFIETELILTSEMVFVTLQIQVQQVTEHMYLEHLVLTRQFRTEFYFSWIFVDRGQHAQTTVHAEACQFYRKHSKTSLQNGPFKRLNIV